MLLHRSTWWCNWSIAYAHVATHVCVLVISLKTAHWLSNLGQGCLPVNISSTVQPSDQMSALRPAGVRADSSEGVGACTKEWVTGHAVPQTSDVA
jgi:hypothetical protein